MNKLHFDKTKTTKFTGSCWISTLVRNLTHISLQLRGQNPNTSVQSAMKVFSLKVSTTLCVHTALQRTMAFNNCKLNEAFLTAAGGTAPLGLTDGCHPHIKPMKCQTVIITRLKPHLSILQFNSY